MAKTTARRPASDRSGPVTAESITDEQIKSLRDAMGWKGARCEAARELLGAALRGAQTARAFSAHAWNAKTLHCGGLICSPQPCGCDCDDCERAKQLADVCRRAVQTGIAARCKGRGHRDHVADVCNGECCSACGGPIDENQECRC